MKTILGIFSAVIGTVALLALVNLVGFFTVIMTMLVLMSAIGGISGFCYRAFASLRGF